MNNDVILATLEKRFDLHTKTAKILVVGLGKTGLSVAHYLRQLGFQFAMVDSRDNPPFNDVLLEEMPDVPVFTGGFDAHVFSLATHLIVSPGVSMNEPLIQQALKQGVQSLSDIDLFACSVNVPVAAITGSNGKSTVTTMLGTMAKLAGQRVAVGGNLGTPALDLLADDMEMYVLELSSFQLERTSALNATVATILNISADHLDRYKDMSEYIEQKQKVYSGNGVMLINLDDSCTASLAQTVDREKITFSVQGTADYCLLETPEGDYLSIYGRKLLDVKELFVSGSHNQANALAALALGCVLGLSEEIMCKALRQYKGLKHRMQFVADINGVSWVNDSKATNVGACIAALNGFKGNVVLIAGGDAKGADMSALLPILQSKVKLVILIGKDATLIKEVCGDLVPAISVGTLKKAVQKAKKQTKSGDTVLLSPACASLDQFANYQERGNTFIQLVKVFE